MKTTAFTCASFLRNATVKLLSPATSTVWLVSFARGLFSHFLRAFAKIKSHKIFVVHVQREQTVLQSVLLGTIYIATNRSMSASVPLTASLDTEAIEEVEVLRKHRYTNQMAVQGQEQKYSFLRTS